MATGSSRRSTRDTSIAVVTACPVERAIHVIGGKWKLLLLRSLLLNGPQGYNELLASVHGISAKELTRNLGELAAAGLVARGPVGQGAASQGQVEPAATAAYSLTEAGQGLMPTFESLLVWGQKALPLD
jgi:DNA-binding HxlR family transcriptional regulator